MKLNKGINRILSAVTAIVICLAFAVGCTGKKTPNSATDLEIYYWNSGVGSDYMVRINEAFKRENPEITIHFTPTPTYSALSLYAAPESNTIDLYLMPFPSYLAYQNLLEPLNDVLAKSPDGSVTIADKIGEEVGLLTPADANGNTYVLPYTSNVTGIVYNADIFKSKGYSLPRTSNELIDLADEMADEGVTPFIFSPAYCEVLYRPWIAQLDGLDTYYELSSAIYTDGNGAKHSNDLRALTDYSKGGGRYEALKALRELICKEKNIYYGCTTLSHTVSQTYFLNGSAAMCFNGSWMENEMRNVVLDKKAPELGMMRMPVISALGTKLGITDRQLAAAVAYADGEATAAETAVALSLSPDVLQRVSEARSLCFSLETQHTMFVPNYSVAKEAAKKYIEFYFSDKGMKIMADTTNLPLPATITDNVSIDRSSWSNFSKQCYELSENSRLINTVLSEKINYLGGVNEILYSTDVGYRFAYSQNEADMWDLDKFINNQIQGYQNNWQLIKDAAGIA